MGILLCRNPSRTMTRIESLTNQASLKAAWAPSEASSYLNVAALEYSRCHAAGGRANDKKKRRGSFDSSGVIDLSLRQTPAGKHDRTSTEWLQERKEAAGGSGWDARKEEPGVSTGSQRHNI